jgi:hypothetical protein
LGIVNGKICERSIWIDTKSVALYNAPDDRVAEELVAGVANSGRLQMTFALEGSDNEFRTEFYAPGKLAFRVECEGVG